jgi:hypothetical protein
LNIAGIYEARTANRPSRTAFNFHVALRPPPVGSLSPLRPGHPPCHDAHPPPPAARALKAAPDSPAVDESRFHDSPRPCLSQPGGAQYRPAVSTTSGRSPNLPEFRAALSSSGIPVPRVGTNLPPSVAAHSCSASVLNAFGWLLVYATIRHVVQRHVERHAGRADSA